MEKEKLDLENKIAVDKYLAKHKPEVIFLAAAKVGGIEANRRFQSEFLVRNLNFFIRLMTVFIYSHIAALFLTFFYEFLYSI